MKNSRYELGLKTMTDLHGDHVGMQMIDELKEICPEIVDMTIEWCFGEIAARTGIDYKTRELIIIGACLTLGYALPQLQAHVESAFKVGASKAEIIEVFLQMVPYAGMANVSNGLRATKEIFKNAA